MVLLHKYFQYRSPEKQASEDHNFLTILTLLLSGYWFLTYNSFNHLHSLT